VPDSAHDALADRVGTWCPDGGLNDPCALDNEDGTEGSGELRVAIADEELERACLVGEMHGDVVGLLGHPVGYRVMRDASDPYEATVVVKIAQTLGGAMTMPMVASSPWMRR